MKIFTSSKQLPRYSKSKKKRTGTDKNQKTTGRIGDNIITALTWKYFPCTMIMILAFTICHEISGNYVNLSRLNVRIGIPDNYYNLNESLFVENTIILPTKQVTSMGTYSNANATATTTTEKATTTTIEIKTATLQGKDILSITDDFDLSVAKLDCGWHKCFITSLSNKDIGYLVGRDDPDKQLSFFSRAWKFSKWIDREFGMGSNNKTLHSYTDEHPSVIKMNTTTLNKINNLVYLTNHKKKYPTFYKKREVVIQKMKRIPMEDMLFFGCFTTNYYRFQEERKNFTRMVVENGYGIEFYNNTKDAYNIIKQIFDLRPAMLHDFQALFDNKGQMYFFDLDAQYEMNKRWEVGYGEKKKQCLERIEWFCEIFMKQQNLYNIEMQQ